MRDAKLAIEFLQKNTHQDDGKRADGRWRAGFNCPFVGTEGEAPRAQEGEDGSRVEAARSTWIYGHCGPWGACGPWERVTRGQSAVTVAPVFG
jgi:hypothetical protein